MCPESVYAIARAGVQGPEPPPPGPSPASLLLLLGVAAKAELTAEAQCQGNSSLHTVSEQRGKTAPLSVAAARAPRHGSREAAPRGRSLGEPVLVIMTDEGQEARGGGKPVTQHQLRARSSSVVIS